MKKLMESLVTWGNIYHLTHVVENRGSIQSCEAHAGLTELHRTYNQQDMKVATHD